MHARLPIALLVLVAGIGLIACGGSESDEEQIADVISASVTSNDPADCEKLATLRLLEQTESVGGSAALHSCEEDADDDSGDPDSVAVTKIEVAGGIAAADVAFEGGGFDGQTVRMALVDEGGWKVDQIEEFVVFDRARILAAIEESFDEEDFGKPQEELAQCMLGGLQARSDQALEEVLLGGQTGMAAVIEECQ